MTESRAREKGFTLLEMALVLGILAVLAAIFLPIGLNQLRQADIVKANADIQELASALTLFYKDLRHLPACNSPAGNTDCSPRIGTGANDNNNLQFLAVGPGDGSLASYYPPGTTVPAWGFADADETTLGKNNAFNHFVINNPDANGQIGTGNDYATSGTLVWAGPYVTRLGLDPWGNAYIISIGAMEASGLPIAVDAMGWIISAGPNGTIETPPDSPVLVGDDIGVLFTVGG